MSVVNETLRTAAQNKKESAPLRHEGVKEAIIARYQGASVNQKKNGLVLAVSLLFAAALAAAVLFYVTGASEKKLKIEVEQQLAAKTDEAVKKQTQVDQLVRDKNDMFANAGRLQSSVRYFQGRIDALSGEVDALKKENRAVKLDNTAKDRTVTELYGKLHAAESEQLSLSEKLSALEARVAGSGEPTKV